MKKVKDIMTQPLTACAPQTSLREAEDLMNVKRVGALPVIETQGQKLKILGIVTLRDLTGFEDKDVSVLQAMTAKMEYIREADSIQDAAKNMVAKHIHHLVVLGRKENITGILSAFDFVRLLAREN